MKEYFIWLLKLLTLVVIFCVVVPLLLIAISSATEEVVAGGVSSDKNLVAVVELKDIISSSKDVLEELYKQSKNDKVKGIVLRIDSPGGAVGPSQDIYAAVRRLKQQKPIVVSMGTVAASGGLYAALGGSKIYCQPGTITGSIGVILQIPNLRKISEYIGFNMVTIKSGELKDVGNTFRDMTDKERDFLQGTVQAAHEEFIKAVAEGRSIPIEKVRSFADGRIILGAQARELKLVDDYGDIYDAARAVFDILGTPLKADELPKLHYPSEKFGQLKKILEGVSHLSSSIFPRQFELQYLMY